MSNPVESAIKATSQETNLTKTGFVVVALASYGAGAALIDAVSVTKRIARKIKAKRAAKVDETAIPQQ